MYGLEALSFNVKDGYVGKDRSETMFSLLPYQGRVVVTRISGFAKNYDCAATLVFILEPCHADAVVRGHRSGLLTTADYNNLCQCETLDDIKLNLVRVD